MMLMSFFDKWCILNSLDCFWFDLKFHLLTWSNLSDYSWYGEFCRDCFFCSWPATNGNSCHFALLSMSWGSSYHYSLFTFTIYPSKILQVLESINKCDVDIRRELFSSILVNFQPFNVNKYLNYTKMYKAVI